MNTNTGWFMFLSKVEIVIAMIFGAFSAITGKLRKFTSVLLIFEVIANVLATVWSLVSLRSLSDSWKETFSEWKTKYLDPEWGPEDDYWYDQYVEANEEKWKWRHEYNKLKTEKELDELFGVDK